MPICCPPRCRKLGRLVGILADQAHELGDLIGRLSPPVLRRLDHFRGSALPDAAGLRAYGIGVFYTGAQQLDRYRQMAVIAIEARQAAAAE